MIYRQKNISVSAARFLFHVAAVFCLVAMQASPSKAHPHVFVDGGVDFVFGEGNTLSSLRVTWLYEEFETLYILSSYGMSLNSDGDLDEGDKEELIKQRSNWPSDFEGSSHLSVDGQSVLLGRPFGFEAESVDGRLKISFTRNLTAPVDISGAEAEIAFYESTYFYAFSVTQTPELQGPTQSCKTTVLTYDPTAQDKELQGTLAKLSREETPSQKQVGALFADKIGLKCE